MPELPELEVICEVLNKRLSGSEIAEVTVFPRGGPLVIRDLSGLGFAPALAARRILNFQRAGKFLQANLDPADLTLVVNFKLSGRFQLAAPHEKKAGPVHVVLHFAEPVQELRYIDPKRMGQLYLVKEATSVPTFSEMGPDALDASLDQFQLRLRRFPGEIKGILSRERFLAGIGNAYADEILWEARLHPYRKRPSLSEAEIAGLHQAMRTVLLRSIEQVREAMGESIHLKPRDFFAIHMRGGDPCPRCGTAVSSVTANQRITNFCRTCQPGGLIKGM